MIPALEGRSAPTIKDTSRSFEILLAEDNEVNQRVAIKILQKYNHLVEVVPNGLEALNRVQEKRYDVVLMDVQMPVMGGFEATGKIRAYEKEHNLNRTPIIALTAHAMLGDREKCIAAQMDEYLSKPLKQNAMMQTILKTVSMGPLGGKDSLRSSAESTASNTRTNTISTMSDQTTGNNDPRPIYTERAITSSGPINHGTIASPSVEQDDQKDPLARVGPLFRADQIDC